jgi:hypothetical protein
MNDRKRSVVEHALKLLRSQGVRVPKKFSSRLMKEHDFSLSKRDIAKVEEGLKYSPERRVVVLSRDGKIFVHSYEAYANLLRTAGQARAGKAEKAANGAS